MSNEKIAILELLIVGGLGVIIIAAGLLIHILKNRKVKACTYNTVGHIIKHNYYGEGRMCPVVKYSVGGSEYFVKRKFRGIITKQKISPSHLYVNDGAYVSEKDYLHVPMSAVTNIKEMANKLWPLGSEMIVYYNPQKPKQAYAERIPKGMPAESVVFILTGIFLSVISVLIYFVIRGQ